jgi:enoyl-CoA hydratase/carnithine racemase
VPIRLHQLEKPSIAAVNGYAMGLGMGIALSCDIRIASENARFSETFIRRGLIPADGSCWQLPRMIGLGNTLLLQYTGDVLDAQEALRLGIVSKVAPHEELLEKTMGLATGLARGPTYGIALVKRLVHRSLHSEFGESMELAGVAQEIARRTDDHREGVRAFVEKRSPEFKGR